jgi:hypothetical protein
MILILASWKLLAKWMIDHEWLGVFETHNVPWAFFSLIPFFQWIKPSRAGLWERICGFWEPWLWILMTAGVSFSSVFTGKMQAQRRKKKQGSQFTPVSSACRSINSKNNRLLLYARLSQIDPATSFQFIVVVILPQVRGFFRFQSFCCCCCSHLLLLSKFTKF